MNRTTDPNSIRIGASNEGTGSNNTMNLWTWPWPHGRRSLRRPKQRPWNMNLNHLPITWHSNKTKYGLLTVVLLFCLVFRQDYDSSSLAPSGYDMESGKQQSKNEKRKQPGDLSLAVLVAGSTQRFLFDSFVEHVAKPAAAAAATSKTSSKPSVTTRVRIDYFAILTLKSGPAFRQDAGYMGHLAGRDKIFDGIEFTAGGGNSVEAIRTKMMDAMTSALAAIAPSPLLSSKKSKTINTTINTHIRALRLLEEPIEDAPVLDIVKIREQKRFDAEQAKTKMDKNRASFDLFQQFPMMDKRKQALVRTQAGNKNMIRLFLALESLWNTEFLGYENYDYVLILRDDTLWLGDFDLPTVIATDPTADAYILSCDGRDPKMLPPEINDHGVLIRREKANVLGKYVTAMGAVDLQKCHDSVTEWLGKDRGCNSEMILQHIMEEHKIKVKLVPQSILPFERAVLIDGKNRNTKTENGGDGGNDDDFYCYHKFCQSIDQPLELPSGIQRCKELTFDT